MKIGVLGGGQLAKMLQVAASPLGIELICHDPNPEACAQSVAKVFHECSVEAIHENFKGIALLTYETENLNDEWVSAIQKNFTLHPNLNALKITQDRLYEKDFLNKLGIPTATYQAINHPADLKKACTAFGKGILKTRRAGYDGKGQITLQNPAQVKTLPPSYFETPAIFEQWMDFDFEVSMIAVRGKDKTIAYYPLILNQHRSGILRISTAPFLDETLTIQAKKYARQVLEALDYYGVLTLEFFCKETQLIANEIAPRVHNSGHLTIEASVTSQFENHIRAIAGLPLGSTAFRGYAKMINLIGEQPNPALLSAIGGLHYHWYGKTVKPNRKVGHITLVDGNADELNQRFEKVMDILTTV